MTVSGDERDALADLLLSLGPDEPTLCEGWTTRDLTVHLVLREYRPDTLPGTFLSGVPVFSRHLDSVGRDYAQRPFAELVEEYRNGPPRWNPMWLGDRFINLAENFVHHEDARRGGGDRTPRDLPQGTRDALWRVVTQVSRGMIRSSGASVALVRTDGDGGAGADCVVIGAKTLDAADVTLSGEAGELLLWVYGRVKACDVTAMGPVEQVRRMSL